MKGRHNGGVVSLLLLVLSRK